MAEFNHDHPLGRQEIITGADATARLRGAAALLCGIGGVGSWAAEAMLPATLPSRLTRSGRYRGSERDSCSMA